MIVAGWLHSLNGKWLARGARDRGWCMNGAGRSACAQVVASAKHFVLWIKQAGGHEC